MLDDTVTLHSSQPSPERRRSPIMVLIWVSVIVAHLALGGQIWQSISYSNKSGYQTRAIEDLTAKTSELRSDVQLWQAYVISLQKKLMENGIQVPEAPSITTKQTEEK